MALTCALCCGLPRAFRGTEALRQLKFWLGVESLARLAMKHNTSLSEHKRSNATARRAFLAFLAFLIHLIRVASDFVARAISASAVCQQQRLALFCCQEQHTAAAGAAHRALSGRLLISQPSQPSNAARTKQKQSNVSAARQERSEQISGVTRSAGAKNGKCLLCRAVRKSTSASGRPGVLFTILATSTQRPNP